MILTKQHLFFIQQTVKDKPKLQNSTRGTSQSQWWGGIPGSLSSWPRGITVVIVEAPRPLLLLGELSGFFLTLRIIIFWVMGFGSPVSRFQVLVIIVFRVMGFGSPVSRFLVLRIIVFRVTVFRILVFWPEKILDTLTQRLGIFFVSLVSWFVFIQGISRFGGVLQLTSRWIFVFQVLVDLILCLAEFLCAFDDKGAFIVGEWHQSSKELGGQKHGRIFFRAHEISNKDCHQNCQDCNDGCTFGIHPVFGACTESVAAASHPIDEIDRRNKPKMSFLSIFWFFFSGANYCVSSQIEAFTGIALWHNWAPSHWKKIFFSFN